jgi:cell wall-associated NlpC family hydrolase
MPAPLRPLRLLTLPAQSSWLRAAGRAEPQPLPRFTAPTRHKGEVSANDILFAPSRWSAPYRHGGNTPQGGFDCSGLVEYVFRDVAGIVAAHRQDISEIGAPSARDRLESGDLVFFRQSCA